MNQICSYERTTAGSFYGYNIGLTMLAFVHIPKTAGITVNYILRNSFGARHCDLEARSSRNCIVKASDVDRIRWIFPRLKSIAGHYVTAAQDLSAAVPEIDYFTFLREPLRRTASHYQYHVHQMEKSYPFEDFINRPHQRNVQVKYIAGEANLDKAIDYLENRFSFVGLTERFNESAFLMKRRFEKYNLDPRFVRRNVATDNHIKESILKDAATRAMLEAANELDVQLYRYVTDVLYPRQKASLIGLGVDWIDPTGVEQASSSRSYKMISNQLRRHLIYRPYLKLYRRFNTPVEEPQPIPVIEPHGTHPVPEPLTTAENKTNVETEHA